MNTRETDILVAGGGVAGLTAAVAFGAAGFRVICVDPALTTPNKAAPKLDLRTTAFLRPARDLLERSGVWPLFTEPPAPLQVMRIMDISGGAAPVTRSFDANDIGADAFGWNLRNSVIKEALLQRSATLQQVELRPGVGVTDLVPRETETRVTLTDGEVVAARMVVACDGRDSPVRSAVGLTARTLRYGQKALSFAVSHPTPHDNVSTEIHDVGGPFTLVPLPDHDGNPASAVVWMTDGPDAQRLSGLPRKAFEIAATARSDGALGPLSLLSGPQVWPIISRIANRLNGPRTALIGEAAHVVPPIGAQGLNMSLADLDVLLALAETSPSDLGSRAMLDEFHRRRYPDLVARVAGIDALNRASMAGAPLLQTLRRTGLKAFHDVPGIRTTLMKLGLGTGT